MRKKINTLADLGKRLKKFDKLFLLIYFLNIVMTTVNPYVQLLGTGFIIQALFNRVNISDFVLTVLLWTGLILLTKILAKLLDNYLMAQGDLFRINVGHDVMLTRAKMDYQLLLEERNIKLYNSAITAVDHRMAALNGTIDNFANVISNFISIIISVEVLQNLHPLLALLIGVFVLFLISFKIISEKINRKTYQARVDNSKKFNYVRNVSGDQRIAKDVRLYSMFPWIENIKNKIWMEYQQIKRPANRIQRIEGIISVILTVGLIALTFYLSVGKIITGEIKAAEIFIYTGVVTLAISVLSEFINSSYTFRNDLTELTYVYDYFNQKTVFNHKSSLKLPDNPTIELKEVSFKYPNADKVVFENLNLKIPYGQHLAVVGENGAGKTTLVKLILGLLQPSSGEILINGINREKYSIEDYYQMFAPVFQDNYLYTFSIKSTILQGYDYDEDKYKKVCKLSGINKFINSLPEDDETKINRQIYKEAVELSGGQMQKLKLAQALYKDANVLVLDEPTAALDPISESEVYQNYFKFSQGKSALFISHRLASTQFCDEIIYLSDGKIKEKGTHAELLANKAGYYKLYETQAYYYHENLSDRDVNPIFEEGSEQENPSSEVVEVGGVI